MQDWVFRLGSSCYLPFQTVRFLFNHFMSALAQCHFKTNLVSLNCLRLVYYYHYAPICISIVLHIQYIKYLIKVKFVYGINRFLFIKVSENILCFILILGMLRLKKIMLFKNKDQKGRFVLRTLVLPHQNNSYHR